GPWWTSPWSFRRSEDSLTNSKSHPLFRIICTCADNMELLETARGYPSNEPLPLPHITGDAKEEVARVLECVKRLLREGSLAEACDGCFALAALAFDNRNHGNGDLLLAHFRKLLEAPALEALATLGNSLVAAAERDREALCAAGQRLLCLTELAAYRENTPALLAALKTISELLTQHWRILVGKLDPEPALKRLLFIYTRGLGQVTLDLAAFAGGLDGNAG
ncbi:unnamed protein product, partial [Phaeothamnion confervicola]